MGQMKKVNTYKVTAKYSKGNGIRFKLGTFFLSIGTRLISRKVKLYIEKEEIGELIPLRKKK